jgi:hypothetical protein
MKQGEAEQVCGLASTNCEVNNLISVIMLQLRLPSVSVGPDARLDRSWQMGTHLSCPLLQKYKKTISSARPLRLTTPPHLARPVAPPSHPVPTDAPPPHPAPTNARTPHPTRAANSNTPSAGHSCSIAPFVATFSTTPRPTDDLHPLSPLYLSFGGHLPPFPLRSPTVVPLPFSIALARTLWSIYGDSSRQGR